MADNRPMDFDALRQAARQQSWFLTREQLGGPSGGGFAYLCIKSGLLEGVRSQAAGATKIGATSDESWEQAAALVRNLSKAMVPDSGELGVFKVAQRLDGRLKREIKALSSCAHPSLVPVFSHASGEDPDWYIMKYFAAGDLHHCWSEYHGKVVEVLSRTREVAEALVVIHAKNLIHRDIKPENIFVAADGRWVLGDFGIVFEQNATRHTEHGPTPMSKEWRPEWVVSRHVDKFEPVVDLHSLARVAYAMIAGPGKNPPVSHLDEPDFDLRHLHRGSDHIEAVQQFFVDHITHKPGQSKSQTAQEFITKVDELLALFTKRRGQQQVFSMVLTNSPSWIGKDALAQAQNLKLLLPSGVTKLRGSVRLHHSGEASEGWTNVSVRREYVSAAERARVGESEERMKNFEAAALASIKKEVRINKVEDGSLGHWWDFEIPVTGQIPGTAFLNVERIPAPAAITALVVTAEFLA